MEVALTRPGTYVVAVSGGVDSMALLHALQKSGRYDLVIAHLDHGIRVDSAEDRRLVQEVAEAMGLPFEYKEARLGAGASEAEAREVRYRFLQDVQRKRGARAIVTAHHQDDVLETAIINLLRGSGRKGLTSLASRDGVERPLLHAPKQELIAYAKHYRLEWREDSTNRNTDYLRNYVRHQLLSRFDAAARERLITLIDQTRAANRELDDLLADELRRQAKTAGLDRAWFIQLPHNLARETMAAWLRDSGIRDFDRKTLERLVVAAKTAESGKSFDVLHGTKLAISPQHLALKGLER
jgi:tRNA(Ile)-lysidine synthetase-like protein